MAMQYDVKAAHLNQSGFLYIGRTRLKTITGTASATAGTVNFWDAIAAPNTATYARSSYTVTVTLNSHGYVAGQKVGLTFAAGGATNGNYIVQTAATNTFTITDINSGTVSALSGCTVGAVGSQWLTSYDTAASDSLSNMLLPGEGLLVEQGIYAQISNQTGVTIYYG